MSGFLRRLPTTNFRIFVGVLLAAFVVLYAVVAAVFEGLSEKDLLMDVDHLKVLYTFVFLLLAVDVAQFTAKRATHKEGVGEDDTPKPGPGDG